MYNSLDVALKYVIECQLCQCLFNPFAPGDFAEKRILKLKKVEWFSGHCHAIKS